MDLRDLQSALNARGWTPPLARDGDLGPETIKAIDSFLAAQAVTRAAGWPVARRAVAAQQALCRSAGIDVGEVDGLTGPQTRQAFEIWDARQRGETAAETWRDRPASAVQPAAAVRNAWPTQGECERFYGSVGKNQAMLALPFPMKLSWEPSAIIKRISVHERVHDSAARVFDRILDHYGLDGIAALGVDLFGGSLNVRRMRGGSSWSMHSWGIAIDFDPDHNQLKWGRDRARLARPDADMFWRLWEAEGWLSLGRARDYDWMHVQAARL